ncbi:DUF6078 family protein [Bacteroides thetaiotaomicron]|nr:DUF6078 family protein [Bacteroides thetaiotaomicron]
MISLRIIYTVPTTNVHATANASAIRLPSAYRKRLPYYSAVNPNHIAGNETNCTFFSPFRTVLFASGMDHLLDNIPHAMAVTIRKEMYSLMGRNMYYRIRNKERLLHPDEQKQIAAIFSKHGIKFKPAFDKYIEKYDW